MLRSPGRNRFSQSCADQGAPRMRWSAPRRSFRAFPTEEVPCGDHRGDPRRRRRQADGIRVQRRGRGRRRAQRRAGRDGRPSRAGTAPWPAPDRSTSGELAERTRHRPSATCGSGSTRRPRAASSSTTPPPGATRCPPEQAVALTDSEQPGVPARVLQDRARLDPRLAAGSPTPRRAAPASAGTSTTTTSSRAASASSGPATTRISWPTWLPALDGVVEKLERGATVADVGCGHGVVDDPDGAGVPELDVRRLRLPRGLDRDGARPRRARPASRTACSFEATPAADVSGQRLRPRDDVRLPARHGRPGRRGAPGRASRSRPTGRG